MISLEKGNYIQQIIKNIKKDRYFKTFEIYDGVYDDHDFNHETFLFFRGQSDYKWNLVPSINRDEKQKRNESQILYDFSLNRNVDNGGLIPLAQHYGKSTSALDFTTDIKVALYFACENNDEDGALFIIPYLAHRKEWKTSLIMDEIGLMKENEITDTNLALKLLEKEKIKKIYSNEFDCLSSLTSALKAYLQYGFMVVSDYKNDKVNERMRKQKGVLFYCGSKFYLTQTTKDNAVFIENHPEYNICIHEIENPNWVQNNIALKIRIPKELKEDILKEIKMKKEMLGL